MKKDWNNIYYIDSSILSRFIYIADDIFGTNNI